MVQLLLPCTGVRRIALLVRQWARFPQLLLAHKFPSPLGRLALREGQPEAMGRRA